MLQWLFFILFVYLNFCHTQDFGKPRIPLIKRCLCPQATHPLMAELVEQRDPNQLVFFCGHELRSYSNYSLLRSGSCVDENSYSCHSKSYQDAVSYPGCGGACVRMDEAYTYATGIPANRLKVACVSYAGMMTLK